MRLEDSIGEQWAELEFGGAKLGDKRLTSRLVKIAQAKSKQPMKHWLEILGGAAAAIKGFYRLVGNYFLTKSGDKPKIRDRQAKSIDFDTILKPHIEQTKRRMMSYDRVLVIRDQSDLNYSSIKTCDGLGVIGRNQTKTKSKGLSLGTQFVVTTKGLPLGIAGADCVAPKLKPEHKGKDRRYIPLHQKTTQRWVDGLQQCQELGQELRQTTRIVQVCDREADVYDMFEAWSEDKKVELLVRAEHNRRTNEGYKLFELVQQVPEIWRKSVIVKRQSGKPKKGKRSTRPLRPERKVLLAMQYRTVLLHPPDCGLNSKKPPIKVTLIHVWEEKDPPKGEKKIDWYLISTATNLTKDEAWERVSWYCLRWRIEDFHRVLKSGCLIEDFQFEKADRLKNAIAICMVVAWRIMALTLLGREAPELPADIFYSETEQEIIECLVKKKSRPLTLKTANQVVASLGGHMGRKNDLPAGYQVMWKGYMNLIIMCYGVELYKESKEVNFSGLERYG